MRVSTKWSSSSVRAWLSRFWSPMVALSTTVAGPDEQKLPKPWVG